MKRENLCELEYIAGNGLKLLLDFGEYAMYSSCSIFVVLSE